MKYSYLETRSRHFNKSNIIADLLNQKYRIFCRICNQSKLFQNIGLIHELQKNSVL
jgi:hypothetical protein